MITKVNSERLLPVILLILVHSTSFCSSNSVWRNDDDSKKSLYNSSDFVVELDADSFNHEVYGRNRGVFVEFYNPWCGHCQRFAPTYKKIAEFFKYSNDIVVIAAVDCVTDSNQPLCRNFEIMGYPTVKYFHENYVEGEQNLGTNVRKELLDDFDKNAESFIEQLMSEQKENRGKMIPTLEQFKEASLNSLMNLQGTTMLILDPAPSNISLSAVHAILSLHKVPNLNIKYATKINNNKLLTELNVQSPSIVVINQGKHEILPVSVSLIETIKEYMKKRSIDVSQYLKTPAKIDQNLGGNQENHDNLIEVANSMGDTLFQMDLESALRQSLREIARTKVIEGEKLAALQKYFEILKDYFPAGRHGRDFLNNLYNLAKSKSSVEGREIFSLVSASEKGNSLVWSTPRKWLGCAGSKPTFRGYPCGMWKMFHYLSVNAVENPEKVLAAMHGYIKNFFGCSECSKHFQDMADRRKIWDVSTHSDVVLWLWKAHNEVNNRLAGDATEDPKFPKIQFPSAANCPKCRSADGSWNEEQVEKYLSHMYSRNDIRLIGANVEALRISDGSSSGAIIGDLDKSMLFVLYALSFSLLILLVRMFLKRGYRKKPYVHDLLGKV